MINISRNIEKIEKQGTPLVLGVKSCKSYRKALETLIGQQYKRKNTELEFYTRGLLELYNKFHPEKIVETTIDSWKGKSSFQIIKGIDKLIIIKYQKPDKDSEPVEVRTEVSHDELESMIVAISTLSKINNPVPTKQLSILYSQLLKIPHSGWKIGSNPIFSDRNFHNKYTLILGALDKLGFINYSGGKTTLLNKPISIQQVLSLTNDKKSI